MLISNQIKWPVSIISGKTSCSQLDFRISELLSTSLIAGNINSAWSQCYCCTVKRKYSCLPPNHVQINIEYNATYFNLLWIDHTSSSITSCQKGLRLCRLTTCKLDITTGCLVIQHLHALFPLKSAKIQKRHCDEATSLRCAFPKIRKLHCANRAGTERFCRKC